MILIWHMKITNRVNVGNNANISHVFQMSMMLRILDLAVKSCNDNWDRC